MLKYLVIFFLLISSANALSISDQLSLYIREGENHTSAIFYALNSSYYLVFINCIPAIILEESYEELIPVEADEAEKLMAEYIRRGYKGCANETLELNSSTFSIIIQTPTRKIEASGKKAAIQREGFLYEIKIRKEQILGSIPAFRELEFVKLDSLIANMESDLLNLRRVKTETSIQRLSADFDSKEFEANSLLEEYGEILPYYYPAAAAISNVSVTIKNAQRVYGEDDAWLKSIEHKLLALEAELTAYEKDLIIGVFPPAERFSSIALRAHELRQKALQRGPLIPWYYIYAVLFLVIITVAATIYVKLRTSKKVTEEDVPRIHKLLKKLRGLEEQEEEQYK